MLKLRSLFTLSSVLLATLTIANCSNSDSSASQGKLPKQVTQIIDQPQYQYSTWGIILKDLTTGKVIYQENASKIFLPASTTKLFTVSALLHSYGMDYKFHTPVYAVGQRQNGKFDGNLILVGKGDLTLGGRRTADNKIAYTNFDHIDANAIPGAVLTKQNPLAGLNALAKQVRQSGITTIRGTILVDNRYFQTVIKRGNTISPIFINDNLFDFTATPTTPNQTAKLVWRPHAPGITVINRVKTVANHQDAHLNISANADESVITVSGVVGLNQKNIINTYPIKNPQKFAQAAFTEALKNAGIVILANPSIHNQLPNPAEYTTLKPVATLTSAPLIEYAKLILKVSHNIGANLVPLLLAVQHGKKTYDEGMQYIGDFVQNTLKISPSEYVFIDGAGSDTNRICPLAEIQLLSYWHSQPNSVFKRFVYTLPILGVDGSLAEVAKNTDVKSHVFAKTGTGVSFNLANQQLFLTTKALAGYMHTKNHHWLTFMITVNNSAMKNINTVFSINDDVGLVAAAIYKQNEK